MRKIRKSSNKKFIAIAVVLLLAISIGYAALSTTLTINGTANIASNSWLVYFTNVQVKDGSVTAMQAPTTSGTSTTTLTWSVNLQTPGDFYEYNVDVKNDGTIEAMIGNLSNTLLDTNQAKYLNYSVTYSDGATIEQYDKLNSNETITLKVRIEFKTDLNPEDLPSETTMVTLTYESNYVQADSNAKVRKKITQVGYAVQIFGINEDVDENDNPIGLTFGPATGDNFNNKYVTHIYEETSTGSGVYNVIIQTHTVDSNGDETITEKYLTNSASENVTRTEEQKNKYDINMHEMTWTQIASVSDKTAFLDCMLCGDTKKVDIYLNEIIGSGRIYNQYGDGSGALYGSILPYYRMWNPSYNNTMKTECNNLAVGTGVTLDSNELTYGSNARVAGGYSTSHIRATLIGENNKTNIGYAGNLNLSETTSLYSCLPRDLKNVITAKKVKYVTGSSEGNYSLNDDITDKIWLFSNREMYGDAYYGAEQINSTSVEGLGNDGHGYIKFSSKDSKYYISSYNSGNQTQRICYNEAGGKWTWWFRSIYLTSKCAARHTNENGALRYDRSAYSDNGGIVFGFCIN